MLVKMATFICYHNFTQRQNETATTNQLEEADAQGYEWEGSKAAGKPFQPRTTKFRHQYGQNLKQYNRQHHSAERNTASS